MSLNKANMMKATQQSIESGFARTIKQVILKSMEKETLYNVTEKEGGKTIFNNISDLTFLDKVKGNDRFNYVLYPVEDFA